jgi:ABC-type dipeptide/oligopeptide/nickel transport system ATPase subunit
MPPFDLPPKKKGSSNERFENVRSMVIVGANGSGKSQMGAWIERTAGAKAHRLTAQRALSIPASVQPQTYDQAESSLLYGNYHPSMNSEQRAANKFANRWGDEPATRMLSDFGHVLALLFADEAKRNRDYSRAALKNVPTDKPPKCKLDKLSEIWMSVMPQRTLTIFDDKIDAQTSTGSKYEARHMSDGERVTVYLMGQALCAPEGALIVIDEPEIHLHRAIQGLLWDKIEAVRPDCTFIYITHDLDFAATRTGARKIWVKEFDGKDWGWEEVVPGPALPDSLLFQVLGSRRPILFVEGDETSYDSAIYTALYPKEMVVPRQSCKKVVEATKSMSGLSTLHNLSVRGVVDRDRRGEEEVDALRAAGVLVADVAEVENLLCLPEALEAIAKQLKSSDVAKTKAEAEEAVIAEMAKVIDQQALAHALAEIQFRLNGFGPKIGKSDAVKLETDLRTYVAGIDVSATVKKCRTLFDAVVASSDYQAALRLYNCKGVLAFVAASLGIKKDVYCQMVLDSIRTEPNGAVAKAMRKVIEGTPDPVVAPSIVVADSTEPVSTAVATGSG